MCDNSSTSMWCICNLKQELKSPTIAEYLYLSYDLQNICYTEVVNFVLLEIPFLLLEFQLKVYDVSDDLHSFKGRDVMIQVIKAGFILIA